MHLGTLIHTHVTVDHERVCQEGWWCTLLARLHTTDHENARILRLNRGKLLWQGCCSASPLELKRLLDEALLFEVENVDISRLGAQVVNTILIFVAEARTHRSD